MIKSKQFFRAAGLFLIALLVFLGTGCSSVRNDGFPDMTIEGYHSGDCKFAFNGQIIGNRDGQLTLMNPWTQEVTAVPGVQSNWSDVLSAERIVVYSGGLENKTTGIVKFDYFNTVVYNRVIMTAGDDLRIDPTITKIGSTYYMTSTLIRGNVNESDPNIENGFYTIELYTSEDLEHWTHVSDIASAQNNLEDVDVTADGNLIRVTYEQETRDKAPSTVLQVSSTDGGKTWGGQTTLLPEDGDNEPASFVRDGDFYYLFYSSDILNPGSSYSGASAYVAKYDSSFNLISTNQLATDPSSNLLLYQAEMKGNKVQLLFASDYLGNNNLNIQTVSMP